MAVSDLEWHENRPTSDPRLWRLWRWIVVGLCVPGTLGIYGVYVVAGGAPLIGLVLALIMGGGGGALMFSAPHIIESGMPTAVAFDLNELRWRARSGRVRNVSYDVVEQIVESMWKGDWKDGRCQKYVAIIRKPFGLRQMMWLTPENRDRLETALHGARGRQTP